MVQRSTEDDDDEDEDEGDENVDLSGRKSFDVKLDVTADRGKGVYVVDVKVTCEYDFNGYSLCGLIVGGAANGFYDWPAVAKVFDTISGLFGHKVQK